MIEENNMLKEKNLQKDEFYTQIFDIENELRYYKIHFKDKVVYCNCDDPRSSKFFHYFSYNFEKLGLKKLIATCYQNESIDSFSKNDSKQAVYLEYNGDKNGNKIPDLEEIDIRKLKGDFEDNNQEKINYPAGDFRSQECIELLKTADIVVTHPPASLFREYVDQLVKYDKKFLIVGNRITVSYKNIFSLIKNNKMRVGVTKHSGKFATQNSNNNSSETEYVKNGVYWYTNMENKRTREKLILYKRYTPEEYPELDNYKAVNVDKVKDIPVDYTGVMAVPMSFISKHNPDQFEILGITSSGCPLEKRKYTIEDDPNFKKLNGYIAILKIENEYKLLYARVFIKKICKPTDIEDERINSAEYGRKLIENPKEWKPSKGIFISEEKMRAINSYIDSLKNMDLVKKVEKLETELKESRKKLSVFADFMKNYDSDKE